MRRRSPQVRRRARGMTILEAVFAIGVLAIGFVGAAGLLGNVTAANRTSAFLNASLDVFTRLSAEVQNARCDVMPGSASTDAGLTTGGWVTAAVARSELRTVGVLDAATAPGITAPVQVAYLATLSPGDCPGACTRPDVYTLRVQIGDRAEPARMPCNPGQEGYWVRNFQLTKACTLRPDDRGRGEYGP